MRYNRLGRTGLIVSELCLGAMNFSEGQGAFEAMGNLDQSAVNALIRQAIDAGINFIDTANVYAGGRSEQSIAAAIRDLGIRRSDIIIATKASAPAGHGPNDCGAHRQHLLQQIDQSLARLGTDHVDLYQIHSWDELTPIEETLRALDDIVRSGQARYVGVSNWSAWQMAKALGIAERRGFDPLASVQAYYSVAGRDLEREIAPFLRSEGMGLIVWSPLAGGLLSGKYHSGSAGLAGRRTRYDYPPVDMARADAMIEVMASISEAHDASIARIALAWLLHQAHVTSVIVGATRPEQLADNIHAGNVELTSADFAALDAASVLPTEYPGWSQNGGIMSRASRVSPRRHPTS